MLEPPYSIEAIVIGRTNFRTMHLQECNHSTHQIQDALNIGRTKYRKDKYSVRKYRENKNRTDQIQEGQIQYAQIYEERKQEAPNIGRTNIACANIGRTKIGRTKYKTNIYGTNKHRKDQIQVIQNLIISIFTIPTDFHSFSRCSQFNKISQFQ